MNEVFVLNQEFSFDNKIYEITSIAIEHKYDVEAGKCAGEFIISGDYRMHEISVNRESFSFKMPFESEVRSNVNLDSIEVEINDFTYEYNNDLLTVNVEYAINGEQAMIEFAEESDFEEFLKANDADIIDLSDDEREEVIADEEIIETELIVEEIPEERIEEPIIEPEITEDEKEEARISQDHMINSINSEENYVTYHVHTVTAVDTFEIISNQYNISINDIKRLNNIEELSLGLKLILPDEED